MAPGIAWGPDPNTSKQKRERFHRCFPCFKLADSSIEKTEEMALATAAML
jgi:hypothetical protein